MIHHSQEDLDNLSAKVEGLKKVRKVKCSTWGTAVQLQATCLPELEDGQVLRLKTKNGFTIAELQQWGGVIETAVAGEAVLHSLPPVFPFSDNSLLLSLAGHCSSLSIQHPVFFWGQPASVSHHDNPFTQCSSHANSDALLEWDSQKKQKVKIFMKLQNADLLVYFFSPDPSCGVLLLEIPRRKISQYRAWALRGVCANVESVWVFV